MSLKARWIRSRRGSELVTDRIRVFLWSKIIYYNWSIYLLALSVNIKYPITNGLMHRIDQRQLFAVTNGKHQWVPKDIADAAEKYAKVSFIGCQFFYATSTFPIMHLTCPPQFCITFVFDFSWVLQASQEKLRTMLMQNFFLGGVGGGGK